MTDQREARTTTIDPHNHGRSTAGYVGVVIMLVAAVIACIGVAMAAHVITIIGFVLALVGVLTWVMLARAGYGDGGPKYTAAHTHD